MAIAASSVLPSNSLEDFRLEFNNLVSDVTGITATNKFDENIIFEGATADAYETTLTVTDPTADRTITIPNETGTLFTSGGDIALGGSITKASDLTVDIEGDISLDANGGDIYLKDGGTIYGTLTNNGGNLTIKNSSAEVAAISIAGDEVVTFADDIVIKDGGTIGASSATTAITIASTGNITLAGDLTIGDDVVLDSDSSVLKFGDDQDVTLTHVADTGILLNSTMAIQFNDASQYINAPSNAILDINATDEIELNATLADVNANLDVSGTYTGGGLMTTGGNIVIPNDGNIGSVGDTDAIAISSAGVVTFSQTPVFSGDSTFSDDISLSSDSAVINFGADSDITLTHAADTSLTVGGAGGTTGLIINNTATDGDPFLAFSLSGTQTFTMGVDDGDSDKFKIGTTAIGSSTAFSMDSSGNVAITGDLTVTGDDLYMNTNTSGYILVADGTNYNPVAVSGDVTMSNAGAITIANDAIETAMLNDNIISGQTALTSGLATTDELLLSDGGTLKRVDVSIVTDLASGDATALAIALG